MKKKTNGTETVQLNPDGSIKQSEFRRILSELVASLKADKDFSATDLDNARQMAISDVNDAFGYQEDAGDIGDDDSLDPDQSGLDVDAA